MKNKKNAEFFPYFKPRPDSSFLVKDLISVKLTKNDKLVNNINIGLIDLRNSITRKEVPENKNPKKLVNVDFNKKQIDKGRVLDLAKGIEVLTAKQMLQRLPIAFAQVKEGNALENLLNEIKQLIYFCIGKKKLLKKFITI